MKRNSILKRLPSPFLWKIAQRWPDMLDDQFTKSFSQEGEDMILRRMFEGLKDGFYVDIGAHHPMRFSNTHSFYRAGWSGINVDAMPGSMEVFNRFRPRDTNLEKAIYRERRTLEYYIFNETALNTFDRELARKREVGHYRIVAVIPVDAIPLAELLEGHLPAGKKIHFMSIDVEGFEMEVLESNNWERFRPDCLLVEHECSDIREALESPVCRFLENLGFALVAKTLLTLIFRNNLAAQTPCTPKA